MPWAGPPSRLSWRSLHCKPACAIKRRQTLLDQCAPGRIKLAGHRLGVTRIPAHSPPAHFRVLLHGHPQRRQTDWMTRPSAQLQRRQTYLPRQCLRAAAFCGLIRGGPRSMKQAIHMKANWLRPTVAVCAAAELPSGPPTCLQSYRPARLNGAMRGCDASFAPSGSAAGFARRLSQNAVERIVLISPPLCAMGLHVLRACRCAAFGLPPGNSELDSEPTARRSSSQPATVYVTYRTTPMRARIAISAVQFERVRRRAPCIGNPSRHCPAGRHFGWVSCCQSPGEP